MKNLPKIKYRFERLSSEIYAVSPHENNQQVRIDCLEPRSKKNKFECKYCGCANVYVLDYQNSSLKIFFIWWCIISRLSI